MALDLSGFVTPENSFAPLYKIGDDLLAQKRFDAQQKAISDREKQQDNARKNATATYLQGALNPKHFLTGTNYDPIISTGVSDIMKKATALASQGVDAATIAYAINPDVADLSKSSQNIKALSNGISEVQKHLKGVPGIDAEKFSTEAKKAAFFNPDGTLRDMSTLQPDQFDADSVLNNPNVYNSGALDKWTNQMAANATTVKSKRTDVDANGRTIMRAGTLKMPQFAQEETDASGKHLSYVPKYQVATDADAPILHQMEGDNPNSKQPVRVLSDDVFNSLPEMYHRKLLAEVKSYIGQNPKLNIDPSSPQAELLAKALAYKDLEPYANSKSVFQGVTENKAAPIRSYSFYHGGSMAANTPSVDVYTPLKQIVDDRVNNPENYKPIRDPESNLIIPNAVPFNSLDDKIALPIMENVKKSYPKATLSNIYIAPDRDGTPTVFKVSDNSAVFRITPQGINETANKSLGIKAKTQAVNSGNKTQKPKTTAKGLPIL